MTYFPQPNPANRARRVKVGGSVVVAIRSDRAQPVRAKLHNLSATGGLLLLSKPLEQGDFVEVAFSDKQRHRSGHGRVAGGQTSINLGLPATLSVRRYGR
jgi:hypothetical protein